MWRVLRWGVAIAIASVVGSPAWATDAGRPRLRDLGITIGRYAPGPLNAITDVAGVKVGQVTLVEGAGKLVPGKGPVRTGLTAIVPREDVWRRKCAAASFVLNGNGETTGLSWLNEAGWIETPIVLTDTLSVGRVSDGVVSWMLTHYPDMGVTDDVPLPIVAECDDSYLNDQQGRHATAEVVARALDGARSGPVDEGSVGAGTGMTCYRFKGGIGTASRRLAKEAGGYTVGVLVNCNMGMRYDLRIDGVPVGREIPGMMPPRRPADPDVSDGSIIMVVATDAPLLPHQLQRLAKRAALGLARTGSSARNGSGDFVLAFSTAHVLPHEPEGATASIAALHNQAIDPLFEATVETTEEAIGNALCRATTVEGRDGHVVYAMPIDRMLEVMRRYGHELPPRP